MHHLELVVGLTGGRQPAVDRLVEVAAAADDHSPLGEHKYLRLRRGDEQTLGVLATDHGGELVGYAHALLFDEDGARRLAFELVVHPEHRNEGVARLIIARLMAVAGRLGVDAVDAWAYGDGAPASRLASEFGFQPHRTLLHLTAPTAGRTRPPLVEGLAYDHFRAATDAEGWLALNRTVFAGHPEQGQWTQEDLAARLREPWFDEHDFLVVRDPDGTIVAFNWLKCRVDGVHREAEIYVLGVDPAWGGHGLGSALIEAGLAHIAERGLDHGCVYVDEDNAAAVRRYVAGGFEVRHRDMCYRRATGVATRVPPQSVRELLRDLAAG